MIKENQKLLLRLHILSDGCLVFIAMMVAYWLRFDIFYGTPSFPLSSYALLGLFACALCLMTYTFFDLYESFRAIRIHIEAQKLLIATVLDTTFLITFLFVFHLNDMSRWLLVFFCGLTYLFLLGKRVVLRVVLRYFRSIGYNQKHIIIVGDSEMAAEYVTRVRNDGNLGFLIDGYIANSHNLSGVLRLGDYDHLEELLEQRSPDEVVVAMSAEEYRLTGRVIGLCEKTGTKLSLLPYFASYMPSNPQIDNIDGLPVINLRRIPLDNLVNAFLKRTMDIVGSSLLILLSSPLMLIAVIGVKLSSPGPVIFKQERMGRNKQTFSMYKFRSMRVNAEEKTGWSRDVDPRKTRFGSLIRKLSMDELPQFFNVLKGDMSLVGPRPEVPYYVEQFKEEIPRYMVKHQVRPGITGWAQVNGYRGNTSIKRRIEHDIYYIENWSFFFDLKILLLTLANVINSETIN